MCKLNELINFHVKQLYYDPCSPLNGHVSSGKYHECISIFNHSITMC